MNWISVKDNLPELFYHVLATDGNNIGIAAYQGENEEGNDEWIDCGDSFDNYLPEITHWMPLPELPKKEKGDGK